MKELNNPFVVYGYKGAPYFCDRKSETEKIVKGLSNERNVTLIAPEELARRDLSTMSLPILRNNSLTSAASILISWPRKHLNSSYS